MKDRIRRQASPRASRLNSKLLENHMRTLPRSLSRSKKGVWESHLYKSLDRQMATLPDLSAKQHFRLVGHLWKRRKRVDSQRCLRFSNPTNALLDGTRYHKHTTPTSVWRISPGNLHLRFLYIEIIHLHNVHTKSYIFTTSIHIPHKFSLEARRQYILQNSYSRSCRSSDA
jgi:hypothetical protein